MLAAAMMLASAPAAAPAHGRIDAQMDMFTSICIANPDVVSQKKAASALPDVSTKTKGGFDQRTGEMATPVTQYMVPGLQIDVWGYNIAGACSVVTTVEPDATSEAVIAAVSARFGKKLTEVVTRENFTRRRWVGGPRQFDLEYSAKDGRNVVLLVVRKREGFL